MVQPEYETPFAQPYVAQPPPAAVDPGDRKLAAAWRKWTPLVATAAFGFLADASVRPLMEVFNQRDWGAVWVYMCFGVIAAQGAIASVGLVWTRGPFFLRFVLHWIAVAAALAFWAIGLFASTSFDLRRLHAYGERELGVSLCLLPILGLSIQFPLWLMGQYFGWRLVRDGTPSATGHSVPLTIRGLMVVTLVVALSMMAARMAASWEPSEWFWFGVGIAVSTIAAVSTISLLPISIWLLKWSNWRLGLTLVAIETVLGVTLAVGVIYFLAGFRLPGGAWQLTGLAITVASYAATLAAAALAARAAGCQLQTSRAVTKDDGVLTRHAVSKAPVHPTSNATKSTDFGRLH